MVRNQTKTIIPLTHLLKLEKKILNVLKLSNLNNHIQTLARVKESKREYIIITNADKRGVVVIVDRNDYVKEVECQLNDKDNYHILPEDPTLGKNSLVKQTIDRFKKEKLITDKTVDGLKTSDSRTPRFYITPKIHKPGTQVALL